MAKAIRLYEGGIHSRQQVAVREDGEVFSRGQEKTGFGYSWTRWRQTGEKLDANALPNHIQSGFSTLRPGGQYSTPVDRLRLPG